MSTLLQATWRRLCIRPGILPGGPWGPRIKSLFILPILTLAVVLLGPPAPAEATDVPVRLVGGAVFTKKVDNLKERRLRKVVPQTLDFSCGAAALATVLRYNFGKPLDEREAIIGMFNQGEKDKIRQRGFSMLDMKHFAQSLGYQAEGYKFENVQALRDLKIPVITLINTGRYYHFVVIRQVTDKFVYLSDPSWGNRRMAWGDFEQGWQKVILVVAGPSQGSPEGLYCEADEMGLPKDQVLRMGLMGNRFSMDPSQAMLINQHLGEGIPNAFLIPSSTIRR